MEKLTEHIVIEYKYDSEEERNKHVEEMEEQGFRCDGQVRQSEDCLMVGNMTYYYFARFHKYI